MLVKKKGFVEMYIKGSVIVYYDYIFVADCGCCL